MVEKIEKNVLTAWERVEIARNPKRKTALDYISEIFDEFIELHGDRCYGDDKAMVCGLGRIENQNYTIIAEQKGRNTKENIERNFGMPNPESYRKAIRIMKQAEKFNRPVITFIDTKGAYPGVEAEQRGQGEAIAKSMFEMAKLTVPVIAIVIGEGSSGGALAIGVANKVIMLENAIYSILSPEGYSSILWKDSSRFKEAADRMKLTANDLYDMGIIETVIKESIENYTKEKNQNIKKTMDIEMFGKLSDAFGPSGFEEDVIRTIADYCKEFDVENDAMNNLYVRMPGTKQDSRPVIQLDAHLDACGFMVQNIQDNGCLGIIMLGGFHLTSLPAHAVWIRTRSGKMVHGIICAKPVHFMTTAERSSQTLEIEKMYVDVGATSREEVENVFGIHIGDPMMPDVTFEYDAEHEICFGKAFDNRAGCACIVDTMKQLEKEQASLAVNVVGAFAAQEEVGTRGAVVTSQIVKPDLAIVFEGSPSDDFFISAGQAQGCMKKGVQIRILDNSYISNTQFISLAEEVAEKCGIKYQESVRRGGSTNAAKISVTGKAVPCLVLGVPSRYAHSHYNFCAKEDLEAASAMAANVIRALDEEKIRHICHQDVL